MIIEIIGPPGSGKSTVRDYLIEKMTEDSLDVRDIRELEKIAIIKQYNIDCDSGRLASVIGKLKLYWSIFTTRIYFDSIKGNPVEYIDRPKRLILYWFTKDIVLSKFYQRKCDPNSYHYFSTEGMLQHLVSLRVFSNKMMNNLYEELLGAIDLNSIVVLRILIDPDAGLKRLLKRGIPSTWPFYYRTSRRVKVYNNRYCENVGKLVRQMEERGVKVIEIDTNNNWENVKQIIDEKYLELASLLKK